jgi:ABC-type transport system involved in resistance to organic solvents, ATPase component
MNSSPPLLADDVVIGLRGICTRFGKAVIHENLDLDVYKGEILGLIGGSGTGKSVLLQTILGLVTQAEGTVTILDVCMNTATMEERDRVRQHWGVLFQDGALFSSLTVGENIKFPLKEFTTLRKGMIERIARMKLDLVGLPQTAFDKYPSELSGGMRKRAGLARALVMDPEILLLDEPTAGLDPLGANAFDELVLTMRDTMGLTVVIVTHDLDTLYTTCSRVAVLAEKRIFAADSIENLLTIDYPWINDYFNGPRGRAAYGSYLSGKAKKQKHLRK